MAINARTYEGEYRRHCQHLYAAYGLNLADHRDMPQKRDVVVRELSSNPNQCFFLAAAECFLRGNCGAYHGDHHCGCSHHLPQELFYVKNRETGHIMMIGSECINRFKEVWNRINDGYELDRDTLPDPDTVRRAHRKYCPDCHQ